MRTFTFLLFLVSLSFSWSCDDETPQNIAPIDQLPPATQEGKYTFGCLVNGEAFVTESSTDIVAIYQTHNLLLSGDIIRNNEKQEIEISLFNQNLEEGVFLLNHLVDGIGKLEILRLGACNYSTNSSNTGTLTITKFDPVNYIIAGEFEFKAVTSTPCSEDTVVVTNGRFDTHYIP